jgi:hypothetical protein
MLIVVSAHCAGTELPQESNNPSRVRTFGDQISDQKQLIVAFPTRGLQKVFQLLPAAVDIAHDESLAAHAPILDAPAEDSKFV